MTTELIESPETEELIPAQELEKIDATERGLAILRQTATELSANGVPTDEATYQRVHRVTMLAVKVRTETGKLAKTLAAPYKEKYDAIMAEGKRIGDAARESESLIRPLKEQYEQQKESERIEQQRAEAARIAARHQAVIDLGMNWTGTTYTFAEHVIEGIDIQAAPDEQWAALLTPIIETVEAEKARIETRRQELLAEQEKERQRREAELKQLQQQADEQRAAQAEIDRQRAELRQAQEVASAIIRKNRIDRLIEVGFDADERGVLSNDIVQVRPDVILTFSNEQFDGVISDAKAYANRKTLEIAAKLKEQDERAKQEAIDAAARLKADKERSKRLAPDKKLLIGLIDRIIVHLPYEPTVELQPETARFYGEFAKDLNAILGDYRLEVATL